MGDAMAVDVAGTAAAASPPPKPGAGGAPAGLAFDHVLSLEGHEKGVSSVRFSPDGTRLASASADKTVRIWRVADGACLATLVGHEKGCSECAWSACGRYVVSASDDKNVHLWCVDPDAARGADDENDATNAPASSEISAPIGDGDGEKKSGGGVFGECLRVFSGHTAHVFSLDLSPAGNVLVTGSVDETVRLWDVRRGTCMNVLPAHSDPVTSVRFSPDGTVVCSGSYDGLVRLWSVATGACLRTIRVAADERRRDAGSSDEKNIRDAEEKRVAETPGLGLRAARELDASVASAPPSPVGHVRFSPNGAFLLINTLDGRVRLLDARTGAVAKTFEGHVNGSYCVVSAFARLENLENETGISTCMISGSEDGAARAWEIQSRRLVGIAGGHAPAVAGSSPDEKEKHAEKHADAVVGVDFCSATQTLATCGLERDKTVTLWRARREA